jgi:hypothetical protein
MTTNVSDTTTGDIPRLLDGYLDTEQLAKETKKSKRSVIRWMDQPDGLPYVMLGNKRWINIPIAREWLASRMTKRNPFARDKKPTRRKAA